MLHYIFRNCVRNLRRTILTIGVFAVATTLIGFLLAIYITMFVRQATPDEALRFIVRNKISFTIPLPEADLTTIQKIPGVRAVTPLDWFGGAYKDENDPANFFQQYGTSPDALLSVRQDLHLSQEARDTFQKERTACIIGKPLAERLHLKAGDQVVLRGNWAHLDLTVAGIYEAPVDNENLYFNREYEQQTLPPSLRGRVGTYLVAVESPTDAKMVPQMIDATFHNSMIATRTESQQAFLLSFVSFLGNIKAFLGAVCGALALLMIVAAGSAAMLSIRERVTEIGVLKSLGFGDKYIATLIMGESVVQAIIGSLIGCGLASFLCFGIKQGPFLPPQLKELSLGPVLFGLCVMAAIGFALLASLGPARKMTRLSIISALGAVD